MDIRKVKKLIELLEESSLSEIEIHEGDETIRISRNLQAQVMSPAPMFVPPVAPVPPSVSPDRTASEEAASQPEETGTPVTSPIVGTFYRSPAPNEPSFVEEGGRVKKGDAVCIIEAMKMMNHIDAPVGGTIKKILANDGDPVEYGQTLMLIDT